MVPQTTFVNGINPWKVSPKARTVPAEREAMLPAARLTAEVIVQYLRKHGDSSNATMAKALQATTSRVGHAVNRLADLKVVVQYMPEDGVFMLCKLIEQDADMEPHSLKAKRWLWKNPDSSTAELAQAVGMHIDVARALLFFLAKKEEATSTRGKGRWTPNRYTLKKEPCPNIQQQSLFIQ